MTQHSHEALFIVGIFGLIALLMWLGGILNPQGIFGKDKASFEAPERAMRELIQRIEGCSGETAIQDLQYQLDEMRQELTKFQKNYLEKKQ